MSQENNEQYKQMVDEVAEEANVKTQAMEHEHHPEESISYEEAAEIAKQLKENQSQVTEKYLESRLNEAVESYKKKNFDQAENIFSDLMIHAVKFYKSETHTKMSKFFYFYGDMLLTKLEDNPDFFGEKAQKTIDNNTVEGAEGQLQNSKMTTQEQSEKKVRDENEENNDPDTQSQHDEDEEIVQLDAVIFKDENVEIRDETNTEAKKEENGHEQTNGSIGKVSIEKSDPIDDLQLAWEHLELSRKIYNQELTQIQDSSDDDKKEKQRQVMKQIIEICLRLGDLESWRDNLAEAVKEYTKALEQAKEIEDRENSRTLSSIYFQVGNSLLYENKDFCEEEALRHFVDSAQILENCLSNKIAIPPQEIPSFKMLKKEEIKTDHLKHSFLDDDESKEIKDTLKTLYEKIEDTLIQRDDRDKYKVYQEQMKKQAQNQNQFAQPTQTNVPIKNLGTFGSLKRKDPSDTTSIQSNVSVASTDNTNSQPLNQMQENQTSNGVTQMNVDGTVDKMFKKD